MEDFHTLEYSTKYGDKFNFVSESPQYIANLIHQINIQQSISKPQEVRKEDKDLNAIIRNIFNSIGDTSLLDALSILQLELHNIRTPESATPPSYSVATLDILALLKLSTNPEKRYPAGEINVEKLRDSLYVVIEEAIYKSLESITLSKDPKNNLTQVLKSHEASVRGRQYQSISLKINEFILNSPKINRVWNSVLGFTYEDIISVRDAIHSNSAENFNELIPPAESIEKILKGSSNISDDYFCAEEYFNKLLSTKPSDFHYFTTNEIVEKSKLPPEKVGKVLQVFSVGNLCKNNFDIIREYIDGKNPLRRKNILKINEDSWYFFTEGILLDEIIKVTEEEIKKAGSSHWSKYSSARDKEFENLVYETISTLLGERSTINKSFKYRNPGKDNKIDLSHNSTDFSNTDFTEADLFCLIDGVAFCIEVKAGGIRESARDGSSHKLITDLDKTIKEASFQAQRLRNLIEKNKGIWNAQDKWVDLSEVKELHQIVVCLEDLNSLSPNVQSLIDAEILNEKNIPFVISISDLLVFTKVIRKPSEFLRYVRTRTAPESIKFITAQDELDLFMWFVYGGFYVEVDPRRAHQIDKAFPAPSKKDIKKYENQGFTYIHTLTGKLDSIMYHQEDPIKYPIASIKIQEQPLTSIVREIENHGGKGWLRASATLSSLSSESQKDIYEHLEMAKTKTMQDGHQNNYSFSSWGHNHSTVFCFFIAPQISPTLKKDFYEYVKIKKHWMRAESALGIFFSAYSNEKLFLYMDDPYTEDESLDREARRRGYVPPSRIPRSIPPSVKNQRKKRKRKSK